MEFEAFSTQHALCSQYRRNILEKKVWVAVIFRTLSNYTQKLKITVKKFKKTKLYQKNKHGCPC